MQKEKANNEKNASIDYSEENRLASQVREHLSLFNLEKMSLPEWDAWFRLFVNLVTEYKQIQAGNVLMSKGIRDIEEYEERRKKSS